MNSLAFALLLLSGCFVLYTYFGYGQVLRFIASRRQPKPTEPGDLPDDDCPPIAILICAFNEAQHITRKLDNCLALDYPPDKLRVVVVSDGSSDGTNELVQNYPDNRVALVVAPKRQGKAACINLGMATIEEEFVVMLDARQSVSANAARSLLRHFEDPAVGAVTGKLELQLNEGANNIASYDKGVSKYWSHEVQLRKMESDVHSVIGVTGAIYCLRRCAFQPIPAGTILDDVLIPMNAVLQGYRVRFDVDALAFDTASSSPQQEQRRKVRTLAGNFQLLALRPRLLSWWKNPVLWMYVSHKVMRLLVPVAMFLALCCALVLHNTHWLFALCFWGQIAAYALSLVPEAVFRSIAFSPLRFIRTFVHMHWYVVLGFYEFMVNQNAHIWVVSKVNDE